MMLFLFLETGMLGVFMAVDLLIFFVFWEIGLVPMYFLINQWGSANRNYASLKFMIYTMGGSLGLLLGIQLLGVLFGTFDLVDRYRKVERGFGTFARLPDRVGEERYLLGVRDRLRHQSPGLAVPHLAPRRAHRSAHGWLDDPGGRAVETRRVRFPAPRPAALS